MDRKQGAQVAWDAYRTHWADRSVAVDEVWRRIYDAIAVTLAAEHAAEAARADTLARAVEDVLALPSPGRYSRSQRAADAFEQLRGAWLQWINRPPVDAMLNAITTPEANHEERRG